MAAEQPRRPAASPGACSPLRLKLRSLTVCLHLAAASPDFVSAVSPSPHHCMPCSLAPAGTRAPCGPFFIPPCLQCSPCYPIDGLPSPRSRPSCSLSSAFSGSCCTSFAPSYRPAHAQCTIHTCTPAVPTALYHHPASRCGMRPRPWAVRPFRLPALTPCCNAGVAVGLHTQREQIEGSSLEQAKLDAGAERAWASVGTGSWPLGQGSFCDVAAKSQAAAWSAAAQPQRLGQ